MLELCIIAKAILCLLPQVSAHDATSPAMSVYESNLYTQQTVYIDMGLYIDLLNTRHTLSR
jgi:hypothetical protein